MTTLDYNGPHANMVSGWNDGDDFGTCMMLAFAVCDALHFARADDPDAWVPDEWEFRPGISGDTDEFLAYELLHRTNDELRTFGTALLEWRDALIAAGKGY